MGRARDRSVCHKKESPSKELLFTKSGRSSLGDRRILSKVGLGPSVRLSPSIPHPKSPEEGQGGSSQGYSHSSLLAEESLVLSPQNPIRVGSLGPTLGEPSTSGPSLPSSSREPAPDGLDAERQILRGRGFSDSVISTLQSSTKTVTHKIYFKVWKTFLRFCGDSPVDPSHCNISMVLNFLQAGLEKGLRPATLKVQVSALSSFFCKSLALDPWISRFMRGAERIRPTRRVSTPPWDLSLVLSALTSPPFEPIDEVPLKLLTLKAAFLVAITTARRVGEISALVINQPYMQILEDRIILKPDPAFLPKVVSSFHKSQEIILPSFCEAGSSHRERTFHSLDVRRTLICYLDRSREYRKSRSLFLQFAGPGKGNKASKGTIARWIRQTIEMAYSSAKIPVPEGLKAHSTRAVSTSWAERQAASVDQICRAATWSSPHTFFRHYRLDILGSSDLSFGRKVLQAIIPP